MAPPCTRTLPYLTPKEGIVGGQGFVMKVHPWMEGSEAAAQAELGLKVMLCANLRYSLPCLTASHTLQSRFMPKQPRRVHVPYRLCFTIVYSNFPTLIRKGKEG